MLFVDAAYCDVEPGGDGGPGRATEGRRAATRALHDNKDKNDVSGTPLFKKLQDSNNSVNLSHFPFFLSLRVARIVEILILLHFDLLAERIETVISARRFDTGLCRS